MKKYAGSFRSADSRHIATPIGLLFILTATLASAIALARHSSRPAEPGGVAGQFDYYLLSLSWSPSYCLLHPDGGAQCRRKGLAFVLHGLWPQYEAGGYPQRCATDLRLTPVAAELGATLYPSLRLVQHEWLQHGTCSGMGPAEYFRTADRALAAVHIPAMLDAPRQDLELTARQIAASFRSANPEMPRDALTVSCRRGEVTEVRVCLSRDLRARSCGRDVHGECPRAPVRFPSTR